MSPATGPRPIASVRMLVVDAVTARLRTLSAHALPDLLRAGDVVVVNDAATLPSSLHARTDDGEELEIRLVGRLDAKAASDERATSGVLRFTAALLGRGDHRIRTEDRPSPPRLPLGARLVIVPRGEQHERGTDASSRPAVDPVRTATRLVAFVTDHAPFSPRLVTLDVRLERDGSSTARSAAALDVDRAEDAETWSALYRAGRPVQYAHVPEELALWDVQNLYASRPWAVEMPSAGRVVTAETLLSLVGRGVLVARVTHAAGLSATGDPAIDARLPLPERWEVPLETERAIFAARAVGGRVLAIGTSVVRALESSALSTGEVRAGRGLTDLRLGPGSRRAVTDGVLTGVHDVDTSHYALLGAFAPPAVLTAALSTAERDGLLGHEYGDTCLVWGEGVARKFPPARSGRANATALVGNVAR